MNDIHPYFKEPFIDFIYKIVKTEAKGFDSIYEDFIVQLVGEIGLNSLKNCRLLETCGVVNGRQLYALCERGELSNEI